MNKITLVCKIMICPKMSEFNTIILNLMSNSEIKTQEYRIG